MRQSIVFLIVVILHSNVANSANIIFLSGLASPSHALWNFKIAEALASRGHNITVLTTDKAKRRIDNMHVIDMHSIYQTIYEKKQTATPVLKEFVTSSKHLVEQLTDWSLDFCQAMGRTEGFATLLNYPEDFKVDLIINDFTFASCLLGFLHKFNYPPLVGVSAFKYTTQLVHMMGGHYYFGYIPQPSLVFTQDRTLSERLENLLNGIYEILYYKFITISKFQKIVSKIFNMSNLPSIEELNRKHVIGLINTHPAMDFPVPLSPNIIEVGGLQISDPRPLPDDLRNFIESGKKGAILIAFGTNVDAKLFETEKQQILIEVVKRFPDYNFLWKFEKDISEGKVENLMVKTWLPQNDILAHPNIKAFVSHGGGLSTQEAIWYGVPIVAVPFFVDQRMNAYGSVAAGVAVQVDILKFTQHDLESGIGTILQNSSYTERMKLRSLRFRSRPMKPLDTAIWWIEYILQDPNPTHLRSPVLDMGFWRANLCDIFLYALLFSAAVVAIVLKLVSEFRTPVTKEKQKVN